MLVDEEGGPLVRLIPRLRDLDFRVVHVPGAAAALDFVRTFPKLAMVALHDTGEPERIALVTRIREAQPDLPLLWHGVASRIAPETNIEILPYGGITAGDLVACAERLLRQHFYPPEFAAFLAEISLEVFASFAAHASAGDPFLKASRARLADFSAVLAFSGASTSGHLVVSAPRSVVCDAYLRLFAEATPPPDEALVDVLGECANRIVGRLAIYLEKRGWRISFGVPLYVAGSDCVLWQGAHRPALAIEFETLHGHLFSELCIDAFSSENGYGAFPEELLRSGQCILL